MIKFKLKEIMEKRFLKISDLHKSTGISRNSLSLLINGKSQGIQFDTLEKITRALNIEIEELFEKSFNEVKIEIDRLVNVSVKETYQTGTWDKETKKFQPTSDVEDGNTQEFIAIATRFIIDGTEIEGTIPFNFYIEFNTENSLKLNVKLKEGAFKNDLIYLFDNIYNFQSLFITYLTLKILYHMRTVKLPDISNDFQSINKSLMVTNDLNSNVIKFSLNDELILDPEYLKSEIKESNEKSNYETTFDKGIFIKYKK
ncbi:helix-turn-helix transcriptional regulator [Mammaliicoccus sciuri]|uniref:helix-turn-helix domain-containing protein n=1 Tax=Mammaliicoccus sciuri TaxID=1296 RepID=UPI001E4883FB|nr:helix-turn-helix transcriptional regulator [Mammaliicoccus sciuri]MCD3218541.1 helix-turn-helix transcriptional regulator [Mammaliicoccus sciuri]